MHETTKPKAQVELTQVEVLGSLCGAIRILSYNVEGVIGGLSELADEVALLRQAIREDTVGPVDETAARMQDILNKMGASLTPSSKERLFGQNGNGKTYEDLSEDTKAAIQDYVDIDEIPQDAAPAEEVPAVTPEERAEIEAIAAEVNWSEPEPW